MENNEHESPVFSIRDGRNSKKSVIDHEFLLWWHAICNQFFSIPNENTFNHALELDPIITFKDYVNFIKINNDNKFERNNYVDKIHKPSSTTSVKEPNAVVVVFHGSASYGKWLNQWIMKDSSTIDDAKYNHLAYTIISSILSNELETIPFEFFKNIRDRSEYESVMINYVQKKGDEEPLLEFRWNQKFDNMLLNDKQKEENDHTQTGSLWIDKNIGNENIVININYNATFNKKIIGYSGEFKEWYDNTHLKKLLDNIACDSTNIKNTTTDAEKEGNLLFKKISNDFKKLSIYASLYYYEVVKPTENPNSPDNLYANLETIVKKLAINNDISDESLEYIKFIKSIQFMIFLMNLFNVEECHFYFPKLKNTKNIAEENNQEYPLDKIRLFVIIFGPYDQNILEEINEYYGEFYKKYTEKSLGSRYVDSLEMMNKMIISYENKP